MRCIPHPILAFFPLRPCGYEYIGSSCRRPYGRVKMVITVQIVHRSRARRPSSVGTAPRKAICPATSTCCSIAVSRFPGSAFRLPTSRPARAHRPKDSLGRHARSHRRSVAAPPWQRIRAPAVKRGASSLATFAVDLNGNGSITYSNGTKGQSATGSSFTEYQRAGTPHRPRPFWSS